MAQQTNSELPISIGGARQGVKITVVLAFVLVISAGILFLASRAVGIKKSEGLENLEKRYKLLAHGRGEMFTAWLENLSHQGDRLIKSDLFRLYAAEVDSFDGDLAGIFGAVAIEDDDSQGEGAELAAQLPMMQNMLREFSTYSGFVNARILNRHGDAYIATDGYLPPMLPEQLEQATESMKSGKPRFSPLRKTLQGLEMDVYVPLYSPDGAENEEAPIGALMMTRQVSGKITELLANSVLSSQGERTRLIQKGVGGYRQVTPWTTDGFTPVHSDIALDENGDIPFGERGSLSEPEQKVFSLGHMIHGPDWWVVQEGDYSEAMGPLVAFRNSVTVVAGLGILTALLIAGLAWWVLAGVQSQRIAEEFKALAAQIDDQKRFIDSINANIDEFITLKDLEGKYTYVNDAFAEAVGRKKDELIGMDSAAVFGFDTAKRVGADDGIVCQTGRKEIINESFFLHSQRYEFQISKSPYMDKDNMCQGIVEVYRDMTEFVAVQEKNKRLIKRAMEALGSTIEAADPYLGGHTKLMAGLSVEVSKTMHLSEMEMAEIETAANLSQIGKMFVANEILTKPGKLTDEEMAAMEEHVEHAYRILKDIDIDEGVLKAIYQMNERNDGSGYPKQLEAEDIILSARILSVLNVFCAMIRPRSYRGAKAPREALGILAADATKFDAAVVEALGNVLKTPSGERLLEGRA
ncbi:HD domain-containing phosphohydrolase [Pseudodesulfovibrio piezophilus]|uniref:Putative PAS/PAC sensor protein n=1 Tax=Pseudodesulfovibrio piezophilus (strain DSM 21447 / JCM 15486 / C1TLV30) TaxID=1322246 RepID=M1WKQ1_PSEP2|nr:HD domain-containing phosphohydrolase [Pseudodesulfovibrio piezophilus]CCH49991.1 putative PAS/PAC sensor protein [Pseudodesulfovibrio piezophilus C1TLV30]